MSTSEFIRLINWNENEAEGWGMPESVIFHANAQIMYKRTSMMQLIYAKNSKPLGRFISCQGKCDA